MVEAETKRRTAEQLGRDHVQMYGIPQLSENVEFLRASGDFSSARCARVVRPWRARWPVGWPPSAAGTGLADRPAQDALRKSMSTGGVPIDVVLRKPRPARPELVVLLCDVSGSVAGFSHFTLLLVHALRQQFSRVRVFAFIDTTDEVTHLFGPDADLAVAVHPNHPGGRRVHPRRAQRLRARVRVVPGQVPQCARRAVRCWCSATPATISATRRPNC